MLEPGSYTISATPFPGTKNNLGIAGISVVRKLLVFDQEPRTYHAIPNSDISSTATWADSVTSSNPLGFQDNFQSFIITDSAYLNSPINESGVVSVIRLKPGSYLTLNDSLAVSLILDSAATLQINHPSLVAFKEIHPHSNIIYNTTGSLDVEEVGDLTVTSAGQLNIIDESIRINNLVLSSNSKIQSNAGNLRVIMQGDITITGNSALTSSSPFSIVFDSNKKHNLTYQGSELSFNSIELAAQDTLEIIHDEVFQLNLSSIELSLNSLLSVGNCDIFMEGDNVFSGNAQNGKIEFGDQSSLSIDAAPTQDIFLNPAPAGNTIKDLHFKISGTHKIVLSDTLKVYGQVKAETGVLRSDAYLQLLATETMSAYILNNSGIIEGDVLHEKLMPVGRVYRYIGSSTQNYSVENLQEFIPVTGSFTGASTGTGLLGNPSVFTYNAATKSWSPFPTSSNQELFEPGKGYAVFFRNEEEMAKIKWQGELIQDEFNYTLTGNATVQDELSGWNLVANPYATPVLWGETGWSAAGISNTISVPANTVEDGRFYVWDGEVGDVEFSGVLSQNQAFWVRSINESPLLSISEASKIELDNATTFRKAQKPITGLTISLSQDDLVDRLYYKMNTTGSNEYLPAIDAVKKLNTYFNIFYDYDTILPLAIKNLPSNQCFEHTIGIEGAEIGRYSLQFEFMSESLPDGDFVLKDKLLDSIMLIDNSFQYDFTLEPDDSLSADKRFGIAFQFSLDAPDVIIVNNKLKADYKNNIQWFRDGEPLAGEISEFLSPKNSGNYSFEVMTNGCLLSSNTMYYTVTANELPITDVHIFPNPLTNNKLIIEAPNGAFDYFEVRLLNTNGQEILKLGKLYLTEHMVEVVLPEEIENGLYYLLLHSAHNTFQHKVIIRR